MERLRKQLEVLSKKHTMEIVNVLLYGPKYISEISQELNIPFSTAQQRVAELRRADLIEVFDKVDEASKRAIKEVRLLNFRVELSPRIIRELIAGKERTDFRVS